MLKKPGLVLHFTFCLFYFPHHDTLYAPTQTKKTCRNNSFSSGIILTPCYYYAERITILFKTSWRPIILDSNVTAKGDYFCDLVNLISLYFKSFGIML